LFPRNISGDFRGTADSRISAAAWGSPRTAPVFRNTRRYHRRPKATIRPGWFLCDIGFSGGQRRVSALTGFVETPDATPRRPRQPSAWTIFVDTPGITPSQPGELSSQNFSSKLQDDTPGGPRGSFVSALFLETPGQYSRRAWGTMRDLISSKHQGANPGEPRGLSAVRFPRDIEGYSR
jgi:hypothetical protein